MINYYYIHTIYIFSRSQSSNDKYSTHVLHDEKFGTNKINIVRNGKERKYITGGKKYPRPIITKPGHLSLAAGSLLLLSG